jgi:FKBP-type peptidyl-prolyl cis-trans isomerase
LRPQNPNRPLLLSLCALALSAGPALAATGPSAHTSQTVQAVHDTRDGTRGIRGHAVVGSREVVTSSGLHYVDLRVGDGDEAASGKILEVHYIGWLGDGTRFDSTRDRDRPLTFRLGAGDALKGWDEGLVGMKVGGRRKLVIPPGLGFGRQGVGSIVPPNSTLYYEFELLGVR